MTIQDAIRSGKKFRRVGQFTYMDDWKCGTCDNYLLSHEDILADDWEVEEEKIEITRSTFENAWNKHLACKALISISKTDYEDFFKELGFKS